MSKLVNRYCLWFQPAAEKYEQAKHEVLARFDTAELFWGHYQFLRRPTQLVVGENIYLFKDGIEPVWEDPMNVGGGSFVLKLKREFCDHIWEDLALAFVGATCPLDKLVNGVRVKADKDFITMQVWITQCERGSKEEALVEEWVQKSIGLDHSQKLFFSAFKKKG